MNPEEGTWPTQRARSGPKLRSRKIRIEVVRGPDAGTTKDLPGTEARIGTAKDCDFVLGDPTVSRLHLVLRIEREAIRVLDAGSRNGSMLDGIEVRDAQARPDSVIIIGNTTLRLRMLNDFIELPISASDRFGHMMGASVPMRRVFALLELVAPKDTTLLVEGETGTGKELVAEGVHAASARAGKPFVVFDCSAVSSTLMESELFGHVRGAFTGALTDRAGALEEAEGGTLFLDEIGELPLELQPKLLRALESREVRRVGANKCRRVDVRIIAATNRSLCREMERGTFREDLYYRLAVVTVRLPSLRERPEDIPLLIRHFERTRANSSAPPLSESLVSNFQGRSWPGNVRELRNAVERAISLGAHDVESEETAEEAYAGRLEVSTDVPLLVGRDRLVSAYEKAYLERALQETDGNVCRAAELAGVGRRFVQKAMKRYGLRGASGN